MKLDMKMALESALEKARGAKRKDAAVRAFEEFAAEWGRDRRRKLTPEILEQVRALDATKNSVPEIVEKTGLSAPTVRKILNRRR
jgi:DNA invertase Pin-like site-specific DNA recombinase